MITCIQDASEGRNVAVGDVPTAFLQTKMKHGKVKARVRMAGPIADALVKIDPGKYRDKVVMEGGKRVIYAVLKKALYGALISSLLFWQDLSGFLKSLGFESNPEYLF